MIKRTYTNGKWAFGSGVHCWVIRSPWTGCIIPRPSWLWRFQYNHWRFNYKNWGF